MGFEVADTGYFYVCNADKSVNDFGGIMRFEETLVPYEWNADWIDSEIQNMIDLLKSCELPPSNQSCENCAYAHQRSLIEHSPA